MKKILLLFTILFISVFTTACINNFAIQELNNKAESYMDKGDAETAICRLKSSLDLDDEIYQTHYNLAVAYNTIGNYEGAVSELQKVLDLKPDFVDAYYTMAVAKEAMAYKVLYNDAMEDIVEDELSLDQLVEFNNKAADAVETYNIYLVKKADAPETEQINNKITELNNKIKEFTNIYDKKNKEKSELVQEEINSSESDKTEE